MRRSGVTPPEDACMLSLLHVHYPTFTPSNLWRGVAASSYYTSRFACDINSIYVQTTVASAGAWRDRFSCRWLECDLPFMAIWLDLGCATKWRKLLAKAAHC